MQFENALTVSRDQFKAFFDTDHGQPIFMVNLLKFKPEAEYPQDHKLHAKAMTGQEAYALYAEEVTKILRSFGGDIVFSGAVQRLVLGEIDELWDMVAIANYPSKKHMADMLVSETYQAIEVHRNAGLAGQLNIETV